MGKQFGPVEIRGVIDGMQFGRNSDGSKGVKSARRYNKQAMKKGRNYARTRNNNAEFTGAARAAQSLRLACGERVKEFADSMLTSRLVSLTHKVLVKGPGLGGERTLEVVPNLSSFRRIELSRHERMRNRFQAQYTLTVNADRNTVTLDVPGFNPDYYLRCPDGATDFRLVLVAGVLCDHVYTGDGDVYAALNPALDGISALVEGAILPVTGAVPVQQLVTSLPGSPVLPATAGLVVSLGIEFFRTINSDSQLLAQGNAMAVVEMY
jgi:hypothetical protein